MVLLAETSTNLTVGRPIGCEMAFGYNKTAFLNLIVQKASGARVAPNWQKGYIGNAGSRCTGMWEKRVSVRRAEGKPSPAFKTP